MAKDSGGKWPINWFTVIAVLMIATIATLYYRIEKLENKVLKLEASVQELAGKVEQGQQPAK